MDESSTKERYDIRNNNIRCTTNIELTTDCIAATQIVLVVEQHIPTWSSLFREKSNRNRRDGSITPGRRAYQPDDCQ